ncbi:MAG: protein translocase subunit SecF [Campylobacteraceae bacterium]|jgi:preprotein translocase subunit SecF|nr:protein translocase subunit SecF [Campylobacteraceae bacterium]
MEIFNQSKIYKFMELSGIMVTISIIFWIVTVVALSVKGLNYGIDFAGGTVAQVKYNGDAPIDLIREHIAEEPFFKGASVTEFGGKDEITIRFSSSMEGIGEDIGDKIIAMLEGTGEFELRQVGMVGPKVGDELRKKGLMAIILSLVAILAYIAFRFEWRFGVAAVISEFHDVFIIIGIISILQIDVNLEILAAVLTLLAYSINDTIVIFDRIRDELKTSKSNNLFSIINVSISKTLSRTTLTSLTTIFVVIALLIFGGESIHGFSLVLTIGIVIGTYSSIFIAAPLLKWLKFDVGAYKANIAKKEKEKLERAKMRAQYERGAI